MAERVWPPDRLMLHAGRRKDSLLQIRKKGVAQRCRSISFSTANDPPYLARSAAMSFFQHADPPDEPFAQGEKSRSLTRKNERRRAIERLDAR